MIPLSSQTHANTHEELYETHTLGLENDEIFRWLSLCLSLSSAVTGICYDIIHSTAAHTHQMRAAKSASSVANGEFGVKNVMKHSMAAASAHWLSVDAKSLM